MAPTPPDDLKSPFRVLLTGYGPFGNILDNPSWLAVAPLHNTVIRTPSSSIQVTAVGPVTVTYDAVLALMPGLHARPPRLPPYAADAAPPPPEGYDLILSLGAGLSGSLSLEQVGHKSGYTSPGVDGKFAPAIEGDERVRDHEPSEAAQFEARRVGQSNNLDEEPYVNRGFTKGYERFPEELHTEVDVPGVIAHLNAQGESRVRASTDAGYYLCDFITYCGLAESQRPLFYPESSTSARRSKSLFMHVPQAGEPHTIKEMTEAVRQVVAWVCTTEKAL